MNKELTTKIIIRVGFVVMFVGLAFAWWKISINKELAIVDQTRVVVEEVGKIKLSAGAEYELAYPDILRTEAKDGGVYLGHSIKHTHPDFCDFQGGAPEQNELVDFSLQVNIAKGGFREAVAKFSGEWVVKEIFPDALPDKPGVAIEQVQPKLSEGFVDLVDIVGKKGYRITVGVEGCGNRTYYFPQANGDVIVLIRKNIPELTAMHLNYKEFRALPGVIQPDGEEEIFRSIVGSLTLK